MSKEYAAHYSRCLRYGRSNSELLLREMATDPAHSHPGSNLRLALADALEEEGKTAEAAHARSHLPMSVRDGKPQLSTLRLHRMLQQMDHWRSRGDHLTEGEPSQLRLELAREMEKVGRNHEAAILRSQHPIDVNARSQLQRDGKVIVSHSVTGDLPRFAYGGGEVVHETADYSTLCHNCANGENGSLTLHPEAADDRQWQLTGAHQVHEEGPPINCDHCHREIQSAYGDPDNPEDD